MLAYVFCAGQYRSQYLLWSVRLVTLVNHIVPLRSTQKKLSRLSLLPARPLPGSTVLPAKLPHFLGESALRSGLLEKTPTLRHHLQHLLFKLVSAQSPLTPSPCHSKGLEHISLLPRASFLPEISSLAFLVPPTNSLPRFVCDDCSDCGLCRWFPCVSSLS